MAVNIDEGEPGTFKDRHYLGSDPHRFIEGMLIAARVVGVAAIWIYIRDEYPALRHMLNTELDKVRAAWPDLPPIEVRRGAGAYVCGEESGMIESIEGKRGMPRLRPPYVAEVGVLGRPTLVHNPETLWWVRDIVEYSQQGRTGWQAAAATGARGCAVSRLAAGWPCWAWWLLMPASRCASSSTSIAAACCRGTIVYGYFPGGASGGILPASLADVPLDFDTLAPYGCFIGSAAIVVFSQHDKARLLAENAMHFFAHESCGQCTPPCRHRQGRGA